MGSPTSSDSEKFAHDVQMRNLMFFAVIAEPQDWPRLRQAMDAEFARCAECGCAAPSSVVPADAGTQAHRTGFPLSRE
jgi:hypothetical protein